MLYRQESLSEITFVSAPKVRHKTFGAFFIKYSYKQRLITINRKNNIRKRHIEHLKTSDGHANEIIFLRHWLYSTATYYTTFPFPKYEIDMRML